MKMPSKGDLEKIVECHKKKKIRLKKNAAALLTLYHWTFLKKLANACDNETFRQKRTQIEKEDVDKVAPRVLLAYNEYEKVRKWRLKNVASSSPSSSSSTTKGQPSPRFSNPKAKTNLLLQVKKKQQAKSKRSTS